MSETNTKAKISGMNAEKLLQLADRLEECCNRKGKPSGVHMIDGQRFIAAQFRISEDESTRQLADVADCMAHCIENEALLFECLRTEALIAVSMLRALAVG